MSKTTSMTPCSRTKRQDILAKSWILATRAWDSLSSGLSDNGESAKKRSQPPQSRVACADRRRGQSRNQLTVPRANCATVGSPNNGSAAPRYHEFSRHLWVGVQRLGETNSGENKCEHQRPEHGYRWREDRRPGVLGVTKRCCCSICSL